MQPSRAFPGFSLGLCPPANTAAKSAAITRKHWLLLGFFLGFLLLFEMGGRGLNEPDEGRYANIASENLETDHPWWQPQLSDVGHYDKPPLLYWVTALDFRWFGRSEWSARLPSLLGALLTLLGLGWAAARLYGERVAWLGVLMAGTMFQIWALARFLSPDMLLCGWCTLAIAAWVETRHRKGSWGWWWLQLVFWTMAGWTKATPTLIPLLGLAVYVYLSREPGDRRALRLPLLLPLLLLLSSPWYIWVIHEHPDLKNFFLNREVVPRLTGHIEGRHFPIYYYLLTSLLAWIPWWPLAALALWRQKKQTQVDSPHWRRYLTPELCVLVVGFGVFSLIGSKLPTYTLTLAPWAALVMGRLVVEAFGWERISVPLAVAGTSAVVYLALSLIAPRYEMDWGRNSSLKAVTEYLHRQNAAGIHVDRFSPSLEFYWGETVRYTGILPPTEISDKVDDPDEHFESSALHHQKGDWFIHYEDKSKSPFDPWLNDPRVPKTRIGNFVVGPLT